ncbi:AbrB/MazE/SpoVT family DNA-binding domain-containing protein [Pelomicrobium sp. G1]|uniref:AbrB/MazE/SpoVT family DNA-binding domain-containing protein n=1 Tax=unclassified Pelomicrobium TaxID=2815318 RepID=UPI003F7703F5
MRTVIRKLGNSRGVIVPKPLLVQAGLEDEVELTVERGALVLRRPLRKAREGWTEASRELSETGDDALVWPEFVNEGDEKLAW